MRKKKRTKKAKHSLLSLFFTILLCFLFWSQESLTLAHLPEAGDPPKLYSNQTRDDLTRTYCAAIDGAQHSVMLIIYGLTDPQIIESLKRKSAEGVRVHVVCDAVASHGIAAKLGPDITLVRRFGNGLMHQKLLVIDEKQSWIGSANMTSESLKMHGNLVTAVNSQALATLILAKGHSLLEEGTGEPLTAETFEVNGQKMEMWFLPDEKKGVNRLKELIATADKTVQVAMFTWTRYDLAYAVIGAAKRGVHTEVVIDHSQGKGTSSKVVELLKKNGIKVTLSNGPGLLHHKFLYIDGKTLVNGSANWTKRAFSQNDDCFIVLHDLNEDQKNQMDALWQIVRAESSAQ